MKKILILITRAEVGGSQVSVLNLAKKLKEKKFDIIVGSGQGKFLYQKMDQAHIPYHQFSHLKRTANPFTTLAFLLELKRYLKKEKFDVVYFNGTNSLFGAVVAKISKPKPKTVFTYRGLSLIDPNYRSPAKYLYLAIFKFLLKFIDRQVFVSRQNQDFAKKIGLAKNDTMVYNGLDPESLPFFEREDALEKMSEMTKVNLEGKKIIGSIGRLAYQKNYEFLIKAAAKIKEIEPNSIILIIGEGPKRQEYEKLIRDKNLEKDIILCGKIHDAQRFMKAFDIFVLPSRYEGLSITLIEALFAGLPIIASDVGGNAEMLKDCGMLYPLDDEGEFLEKIKALLQNAEERNKLRKLSEEKSKDFDIDKTAEAYIEIFNS